MQFFSGFSLQNEAYLFANYIKDTEYTLCGFSYGAIFALEETLQHLKQGIRVDSLILLSPAFFQDKLKKFQRLQVLSYQKNKDAYMEQFLSACFAPYSAKIVEQKETKVEELEELLTYQWSIEDLTFIEQSGVKIEVYLGGEDKIIDAQKAKDFFLQYSTVTYIKDANHFLQIN